MQKRFSLFLAVLLTVFQSIYTPVRASSLKIEIVQIKDSGSSPFWSPDGKEIVYIDKDGLYIVSAYIPDNGRKIVSGPVRLPRWSPDGKYIAYVNREGLKIISPDAGHPKLIYPDNNVQMPAWSPDSKWIAFYLSDLQGEEGSGVFAVNIDTLQLKQLNYSGINPFWSGDGKFVFYFGVDKRQRFGQLFLTDLNSSTTRKLAPIGAVCMNFNAKGDLLVFAPKKEDGTALGVHIASPFDNASPKRLTDDGYFPSFSHDDKWISFFKYDPNTKKIKIYIAPITGGEIIEVGNGIYPRWSPKTKELVYEMSGVNGGIYVAEISENSVSK